MTSKTSIRRELLNEVMTAEANKINKMILDEFKALGMTYVPFKLYWDSRAVLYEYNTQMGKGKYRAVKSMKLIIDDEFLQKYFEDKMTFEKWLSRKYPQVQREHYMYVSGRTNNDHPKIKYYKRKFHKENPSGEKPTIFKLDSKHRGSVLAHVKDYRNEDPQVKDRLFRKFTGAELEKFLENEDYVFGQDKKGNNIRTFMKNATNSDDINNVLKKALSEFNEFFMKMDINKVLESEETVDQYLKNQGLEDNSLDFVEEYEQIRQSWALKAVFPNINNIRTWFIKTGIFKSYKYGDFLQLKTTKQRLNFIDSAVFLIANGIYAGQLGQKTRKTVGVRNPREVYVRAGKAATIGKARRYRNKGNVSQRVINRREKKYGTWTRETERIARGFYNRNSTYKNKPRKRKRHDRET